MQPEKHGGDLERVQQFLERLETELGSPKYQNWFRKKTRVTLEGDVLLFLCGSSYLAEWLQKQYGPVTRRIICELWGGHVRAVWSHNDQFMLTPTDISATAPVAKSVARMTRGVDASAVAPAQTPTPSDSLHPRRFRELSSLVVGTANRLAYSGTQQILSRAARTLFLYGAVGTGKSHLLEATAQQLRREGRSLQVLSLSAECFSNYYTQALDSKTISSFRQRFRNVDVLVMDDVDFFDGKRGIQEEFLNTLRKLESRDAQLVLAGDCHPNLLTRTAPEIISRLVAGLVCRIESPDLETRREILRRLGATLGVAIPEDVIEFVAGRFRESVRQLEGAMNTLHNWSLAMERKISIAAAREALGHLERDCRKVVRMVDVERAVCQTFGLSVDDLRTAQRTRAATQPRMLAMYLSRRLTNSAYAEIGQFFGGRNHSTVVSAERRISELILQKSSVRIAGSEWTVEELAETLERQILAG